MDHKNSHLTPALSIGARSQARCPETLPSEWRALCYATAFLGIGLVAVFLGHPACRAQEATAPAGSPQVEDQLLSDLPQSFLDVIARKALAGSLRSAQEVVVDHLLSTADLSPALKKRILPYRGNSGMGGSPKGPTFIPLEGGAADSERAGEWGVWLLDPGQLAGSSSADPEPCPDLRKGKGPAVEAHNLIVVLVRNVHRLCGRPVRWLPARESRSWETFALLDAEPRFDTLHVRYQNPGAKFGVSSLFGLTSRFWTALHFLYLEESVQARCFRLVRNEFLTPRRDLEELYPEMEYLRHDLSFIVWARLTTC